MTMNMNRRALIRVMGAGAALQAAGFASAQGADTYPSRPIRLIVPFAPGGGVDLFARVFVKDLGAKLGQTVFIENKAGAGGNIGMGLTAKAPPDGYTLVMVSSTFTINPFLYGASIPYDAKTSFAPVVNLVGAPTLLIVNAKSQIRSVRELVEAMKARPGAFNYTSPGVGTSQHLAGELFRLAAGTNWTHIPYNGAGPSVAAVVSGEVEFGFSSLPAAAPFVKSGQVRAMAVTTSARFPGMPTVPTFIEEGLPRVVVEYFQALLAPAGTPPQIVNKLAQASNEVMKTPDMSAKIAEMGFTIIGGTPAEFADQIDKELVKWKAVVQASGAKAQ
jgi:tripartite-type tricarboxylate transporter receptor subunit TctC